MNPEGTVLCEACGKPVEGNQHIDGNEEGKLLNMRYEGSARRSQTYNRSIIDRIWNFFSSVRNGVILIVIALVASAIGTIYPQEMYIPQEATNRDPAVFYEEWYGLTGKIYYQLGFHDLYASWWYLILIGLIGVSLVICSIDRFVPLYRALKIQKPKRHFSFLSRQRYYSKTEVVSDEEKEILLENLKKQRYKVTNENGNILAEKNRFSRWGPYVNHIGLIIILLAAILRMTPLFYVDDDVWVREGERVVIPGTDGKYYIENKEFKLELYDENDERYKEAFDKMGQVTHKNYQTDLIIYKAKDQDVPGEEPELEKILESSVRMNQPAKFDGYTLYQSAYQENEFSDMTFGLFHVDDLDTKLDEVTINLLNPEKSYELDNGFHIELSKYYPDFIFNDGEPGSKSKFPRNPAFVFNVYPPDAEEHEIHLLGIGMNTGVTEDNQYRLGIVGLNVHYASGLTLRRDYSLVFFGLGAFIFMFGVIQGMYWQHRRIWINPEADGIHLAAHTNKNWYSLQKDIEKVLDGTSINMVVDQQEPEE